MTDRDMRPTRFDLTLEYARAFVVEWFDQNPLGQIGVIGMRGGVAERIGEMSSMCLFMLICFKTYQCLIAFNAIKHLVASCECLTTIYHQNLDNNHILVTMDASNFCAGMVLS